MGIVEVFNQKVGTKFKIIDNLGKKEIVTLGYKCLLNSDGKIIRLIEGYVKADYEIIK
ncbi:hypothetical protein [Clostridium perfringens]|uniref:Uncharacterized protein n=1 Tax=Clostridium perfringens TaxID=1502 RepID=A0A140GRI8_CLOPF|nr:hypothetical protein [Clostridium perfringens]AMN31147.1 hypothetical protein JFP838_pA0231 [Clostridium perfringens]